MPVALFTNARDEKNIKEWAAHHLLIGFDIIFIFDHKSKEPLIDIFKNFDKRVIVINASHIDTNVKLTLMNMAVPIVKQYKCDWMIYLDADEFLILNKQFIGVKHFLSKYDHAHSLGVNWLLFGSNNLVRDPSGLILENYTKSELCLNEHVKSFVRPSEIIHADNPHFYHIKHKSRMYGLNKKLGEELSCFNTLKIPFYNSPAYIAHYMIQSEETYTKRKILIPRDDNGEFRPCDDIKSIHNLHNDGENLQPKMKYSENVKRFLDKYNN
jgi:hypothetical protein